MNAHVHVYVRAAVSTTFVFRTSPLSQGDVKDLEAVNYAALAQSDAKTYWTATR